MKVNSTFNFIKKSRHIGALLLVLTLALAGCGDKGGGQASGGVPGTRTTVTDPLVTHADGAVVYGNGVTTVDASNSAEGYIMINYAGGSGKVQIQITNPDGTMYPYPLALGGYRAFPLTGGNGTYLLQVLENISGDTYALNYSCSLEVALNDEFRSYLYPNQYADYNAASQVFALGMQLSGNAYDDLSYVTEVYNYCIANITYDTALASSAPVNYIPNPDTTLASGTGICFDYASVMTSLLRSQAVPTKLVVGYSGQAYHAWISVYLAEQGWVDDIIQFDGTSWSLMDPTLGASNDESAVAQYIGDGTNYTAKYTY